MTPDQEAAALWGAADNPNYSDLQRLQFAMQALEYFTKDRCDYDCDTCHAHDDEEEDE